MIKLRTIGTATLTATLAIGACASYSKPMMADASNATPAALGVMAQAAGMDIGNMITYPPFSVGAAFTTVLSFTPAKSGWITIACLGNGSSGSLQSITINVSDSSGARVLSDSANYTSPSTSSALSIQSFIPGGCLCEIVAYNARTTVAGAFMRFIPTIG